MVCTQRKKKGGGRGYVDVGLTLDAVLILPEVKKNLTVPVEVAIFHPYYQGQGSTTEPFPDDFAIVSGNPSLTEEEVAAQGGAGIWWVCIDTIPSCKLLRSELNIFTAL